MRMLKLAALAVGLLILAKSSHAGPTLQFQGGVTGGTVSYGGSGGALVGSNIRLDSVLGVDTPDNLGSTVWLSHLLPLPPSFGGRLNFETGSFQSGSGGNLIFDSGGSFSVTGSAAQLGITDDSTVLFSGVFASDVEIVQNSGGLLFRNLQGDGGLQGTINPLLAEYYGMPNVPYVGNLAIQFSTTPGWGNLTDGFTSLGVTSTAMNVQAVPEPSSFVLAGMTGLVGVAVAIRKRRKTSSLCERMSLVSE